MAEQSTDTAECKRQVQAQTAILEADAEQLARIVTQFRSRLSDLVRSDVKENKEYPEEALVPYAERLQSVHCSIRNSNEALADLLDVMEF